ncbi:NAD(P)H-binding protein [Streptacidiphilus jiangxiensis]|uniref:NAD(P)H-binding protein n=1 Tax=Streptacidiphilus jiangxiensis TaxID=235985 RepID=UPI0005A7833B|nr:NAD(P)H-binding protein [Streptacidiphilus jiangxiensis]
MILLTGVTGTVGREVARLLTPTRPVRVLARDPARLSLPGRDVEVATAAYADHDALLRALEGVRTAFLVTNDPTQPDDSRFLAAAKATGVRHVVKLSAYAVGEEDADDLITRWQRTNEELIRRSGLDWTFLRPRAFMSNALAWAPSIRAEGVVRSLNLSAGNACVNPHDIAEIAARALTEPGHAGRIYPLTGPEAVTPGEQAAHLAAVLQRPIHVQELTTAQAAAQWSRRYPAPVVEALLQSAARQARGLKTTVDPTYEQITGLRARPFRTWAADHATAFT